MENVTVADIEMEVDDLDLTRVAAIYNEFGCLVVRGLMRAYAEGVRQECETAAAQAISLLDQLTQVPGIGWNTPDGTLWIPAPKHFARDKQIMVLAANYRTCGTFFRSAFDTNALDIVEKIVGHDIELFIDGQCLYKEPVGGHPKNLHQDSAYFEHRYDGPVAILSYAVDTDLVNGALHVVPGSHRMGTLSHIDTFSHLGLDPDEWPWERAVPVIGKAGDGIFFHYRCIHGSKENHSDKARPVFIHRYRRPDDFVTIGAATVAAREEAAKHADEARKQNQQGLMVRGFRRYVAAPER